MGKACLDDTRVLNICPQEVSSNPNILGSRKEGWSLLDYSKLGCHSQAGKNVLIASLDGAGRQARMALMLKCEHKLPNKPENSFVSG